MISDEIISAVIAPTFASSSTINNEVLFKENKIEEMFK